MQMQQSTPSSDIISSTDSPTIFFFSCSETPSIVGWAVSQHTDSSKNTQATLKCCYALHSYVGTILNHDTLLESQHPSSRNGGKSSEDSVWLPMWCGNKNWSHKQSSQSHPANCICQCTTAQAGWPPPPPSVQLGHTTTTESRTTMVFKKTRDKKTGTHSSGAVWESRWTSWAVRPNEPSGFRGRKDLLNHASALVSVCP